MYNYIYALLCKATRMYPLQCKTRLKLYIYICPALQGCANVSPALHGNIIYIYIHIYIYIICPALQGCANVYPALQGYYIYIYIKIK